MTTRVVLYIDTHNRRGDMAEVVQQVLFALKETWGEEMTADWLKRIEATQT
jgi:hypothetical protein